MMNKIPNCAKMIFHLLGKRQRFSYEARDALSQGLVQAFDRTGVAALFSHRAGSFCITTFTGLPHFQKLDEV